MKSATPAVVACRAHSGWAAAVGLCGDAASPELTARERIEMADPDDGAAKQPYHAAEDMPVRQARRFLDKVGLDAARRAEKALAALVRTHDAQGRVLERVGILQASGRTGATLEQTLASHALIHTADGQHFRDALATAAGRLGLVVVRLPERELGATASRALCLSEDALAARVASIGKPAGPPWGADQKAAALFAWLLLARG